MPKPIHKAVETRMVPAAWLITFADMMSLILACFVLLVSFSSVNESKLSLVISSIQDALGSEPMDLSFLSNREPPAPEQLQQVARELQRRLQIIGEDDSIQVRFENGGLRMILPEQISFDSARAELKPASRPVLENIGEILGTVTPNCYIEIRGHTDSRPLTRALRFRDNYDLSFARADAVARGISEAGKIPLHNFEIIACGPSQPVASNDTPEGQQANRRVEIFIRNEDRSKILPAESAGIRVSEPGGSAADSGNQ